jgi:hypothetical protein
MKEGGSQITAEKKPGSKTRAKNPQTKNLVNPWVEETASLVY